MITENQLLQRGYKKSLITPSLEAIFPYADFFMQKREVDSVGIKYFIQLVHYSGYTELLDRFVDETWVAEIVNNEPHYTFKQHWVTDIEETERRIETVWKALGSTYYEKFDESQAET